uniref:Uncharacterized protein n=1 Tax=Rhizophora mucronata TaxID=61149 RepID=A0A2P2MNR7_RHIMU
MLLMCLITGLTCSLYLLHIKDRENITCQDLGKVCQCSICYCGCNYINSGKVLKFIAFLFLVFVDLCSI